MKKTQTNEYAAPELEVQEVAIEKGFADSFGVGIENIDEYWEELE